MEKDKTLSKVKLGFGPGSLLLQYKIFLYDRILILCQQSLQKMLYMTTDCPSPTKVLLLLIQFMTYPGTFVYQLKNSLSKTLE